MLSDDQRNQLRDLRWEWSPVGDPAHFHRLTDEDLNSGLAELRDILLRTCSYERHNVEDLIEAIEEELEDRWLG